MYDVRRMIWWPPDNHGIFKMKKGHTKSEAAKHRKSYVVNRKSIPFTNIIHDALDQAGTGFDTGPADVGGEQELFLVMHG